MDASEKLHFALDAIGEVAYSEPFGTLRNDKDTTGILNTNDKMVPLLMGMSNHVWVFQMLHMWPFYHFLPKDGDEAGFGAILG